MKKLFILFYFFLASSFSANAQNNKIYVGISLYPNYSYRNYFTDISVRFLQSAYDTIERPKFSYSAGIFAEKKLNENFRLRVGLNFMNSGFRTKKQELHFASPDSSGQYQQIIFGGYGNVVYNDFYLELPIDVHYFFVKTPVFIDFGISPVFNLYNSSTANWEYPDGHTETRTGENKSTSFNKFGLAFQFGIGYEVKIINRLILEIQPKFQYFLSTDVISSNKAKDRLYNLGLQLVFKI